MGVSNLNTRWYRYLALLALILTACPPTQPQPPSTPQGFAGVPTSSSSVQLSWIAASNADSYALSRSVDGGAFITVSNPIASTTYSDTGLASGKTYQYQLRAQNSAGASGAAQTSVTTQAMINNFTATASSSTNINLSWTAFPGAGAYKLERKQGSGTYAEIATPSGTNHNDTGLTPSTTYTYRLSALQSGVVIAASESAPVTTPAPSPPGNPTNLRFNNIGTTSLTVLWDAPTGGANSYTVERKTGSGAYAQVAAPTVTSFADSGLSPNTTYTYRVKSVGSGGSSSGIESAPVTTNSDSNPNPSSFTATALTTKRVQLNWTSVSGATGYSLERKQGSGAYQSLTTAQSTWTSYIDTVPNPSQAYTYRIKTLFSAQSSSGLESSVNLPSPGTPIKVLFIGNSLTFVNSVPQMIQALATDAGEARAFEWSAVSPNWQVKSGASLTYHSANTTDPSPGATARIQAGGWDFVVLQELSSEPVCNQTAFNSAVSSFNTIIKNTNASIRTVLHLNWVRTDTTATFPCVQYSSGPMNLLEQNTRSAADALPTNAKIVPAGRAFDTAKTQFPGIPLLQSDGLHATPEGSYLAAATYYSLLYDHTPTGLTNNVVANAAGVISTDPGLLSSANNTVSTTEAQQLQSIAWQTVQNMPTKYRLP
jgi:fibronectin type 3 domain-containing protein